MAGAEPEVDGARKDQAGAAKIAKYTAHEKTKTGTITRRARARARADNGWECHVEIEWVDAQWLTPHCGGLSAGRGGEGQSSKTAAEESKGSVA